MATPPVGPTVVSSGTPTAAKERTQILLDGAKILAFYWTSLRENINNLIVDIVELPDCKLGSRAVEYRTGPLGNAQQPEEARIKSYSPEIY
jgi:hypothetical protein